MELDGACIRTLAPARQPFHLHGHFRGAEGLGALLKQADVTAHHKPDDGFDTGLGHLAMAGIAAIAQNRIAVAKLEDFLEPVGYEDDRYAFPLQAANDRKQLFDLGAA